MNASEQIRQAAATVLQQYGVRLSILHSQDQLLNDLLEAVTPLIEARALRTASVALGSNLGSDELPDPRDRLERWADNLEQLRETETDA